MPSENVESRALGSRLLGTCLGAIGLVSFVALLASYTHWTFGPFPKLIPPKPFLTLFPQDAYPDDRINLEDTAALYIQTPWNYVPSFPECDLPEDALLLFPPDFESPIPFGVSEK
jgi:hypothetical protein